MWVDSDVTYSLEEALLYLKYLNGGFGFYKHTAFHFTRCCLMNWSGLLWCFYYQLFGLSFWRHPFTAEHPLLSKWCNATFQICSDEGVSVRRKEVSRSHLFTKIKTSEHLQRSCLCFLKVNGAFKYENPSSMKAQCMGTLAVRGAKRVKFIYWFVHFPISSFWRHPFTAEDPLASKWWNATFLQICSDEETNSFDGRGGESFHFPENSWLNYSFKQRYGLIWFVSVNQFKLSISMNQFGFCSGIFLY